MSESARWYVVKRSNAHCEILTQDEFETQQTTNPSEVTEQWGPFASEGEAIARRVGLIRSGKCQPS
ncbi:MULTISPECIES: hypothetical protein [Leptolyngbya]|uniref:DDE transposase family protein n=2 Tax=Leptolyngbya boryana TaxID=1184 RepID=A0A1Z4JCL7_LEPBY|nr:MULTISPECIES: hypothetical protein [Leptolyngbya]BAY54545.1 hypothetical protein NIES2135_13620 [Leptolyngbya boryana NIES-2135]MBD1859883.1 hypothetical protein [Leptolyngbya sp. FACHB-1624]MBD2365538.1 hypothetical protein [Leptolyngbya sp. FACHB-161]MBD2371718.1 hypothetical protein [Leptolyngbya sp. FACHB-238]MBD2396143.1 hypothetical protein [Leptolyngbya sp. FACHB-239]